MKKYHRYPRRSSRTGFSVFIVVIILAVAAGYAGTKYIISPYLLGGDGVEKTEDQGGGVKTGADQTGGDNAGTNQTGGDNTGADQQTGGDKTVTDTAVDVIPDAPSIIIDQQNVKNGPFSAQLGSFTTKDGADAFSAEIAAAGIYSYVYESGGSYKVLGLPYSTEEKAKEAVAIVSSVVPDVFVVDLSDIIP